MLGIAEFPPTGGFPGSTVGHEKACQPGCADNVMEESSNGSQ